MTTHVGFPGLSMMVAVVGFAAGSGCGSAAPAEDTGNDGDAGNAGSSSSSSSSSSSGAAPEPDASAGTRCEGTCQTTTLTVTLGAKSGAFDRVQFGFTGTRELHVEAYRGGDAACPQEGSPSPDFTLVLDVPRTESTAVLTRTDGLAVGFLDFSETIDPVLPPAKVTVASLTPAAWELEGDEPVFAFDLRAEFAQGAVIEGHGFARHCASLDEPP